MADRLGGELERHFRATAGAPRTTSSSPIHGPGTCSAPPSCASTLYEALEHAEVRRITFHGLRHTFGTQMAAAGARFADKTFGGRSDGVGSPLTSAG
ncbi:MAG: hypothetical protein M3P44_05220 [Actinomycetota bacterium]|nr:hypothetical protein [Actinomycetota bacterium]